MMKIHTLTDVNTKYDGILCRNQHSSFNFPSRFNGVIESSLEILGFDIRIMNSSRLLGLIIPIKIPIIQLGNRPISYLDIG